MDEKTFNLLREPWILALKPSGETEEVSLSELFERAHEFKDLAGELAAQDMALLRLLLAVLHAVFSRYDLNGKHHPITTCEKALKRWQDIWDNKKFPMRIIKDYLEHYEERFYLFHPQYPFYQVSGLKKATKEEVTLYRAPKLNGEFSESSNKVRLFQPRAGVFKDTLSYAESARWLIYVNAFDDTSAKPKGSKNEETKLPSPGAGWLGQLGLTAVIGNNLFETLMLNFVLIKDGDYELWGPEKPVWELEEPRTFERTEIPVPNNQSELLTVQSRRLFLERNDDYVVGYKLLGGDFFQKGNTFVEQMTIWKENKPKNKNQPTVYLPKRHDPSKQLWRDFSSLFSQNEGNRRPGVISWVNRLKYENIIDEAHFKIQTSAVKYKDKDFCVVDTFSDGITINADMLDKLNENWIYRIINEISVTEKMVNYLVKLSHELALASGSKNGDSQQKLLKDDAKQQAYFFLDQPFRRWLEKINPLKDDMEGVCTAWREKAKKIIRQIGTKLVYESGSGAFIGRIVEIKKPKKQKIHYTSPKVYNWFLYNIKKL